MKGIFITAAAVLALAVSITVHADNEINVIADSDTHIITVSGELGASNAKKRVMITVLSKGGTASDMDTLTEQNIKQSIAGIYMAYTNESGEYETSFLFEAEAGTYTAVVSGPGKEERFGTEFFNPGDVSLILRGLEEARKQKNAAGIKTILDNEENLKSIGLGGADEEIYGVKYAELDIPDFTLLANYNTPYALAADFIAAYYDMAVVKAFNNVENEGDVPSLIEKCDEILGITGTKAYGIYAESKNRSPIDAQMRKGGFASTDDIVKRFCDNVYLNAVSSMQNWSEFTELLKQNNDYLGFDLSGYNRLKNPSQVDKAIAGKNYSSTDALRSAFEKAVRDQADAESGSGSSRTSGGGGGGGGGTAATNSKNYFTSGSIGTVQTDTQKDDSPAVPETAHFKDIDQVPWAKEAIEGLAARSILAGKAEGEFFPNDIVTREECAKILVEAFGADKHDASCSFTDLDSSHWSYIYVAAAQRAGIINGYEDGSFGTGRGVTRQEIAAMLYRTAVMNGISFGISTGIDFNDGDMIAPYARTAVDALCDAGIISGRENGYFAPEDECTRAEAAKLVYAVMTMETEDAENE